MASGAREDMNLLAQHSDAFLSGDTSEATTITEVDLDKSAILLLGQHVVGVPSNGNPFAAIRGRFTSSTVVTFTRGVTGFALNYDFAVVEFPSAISVKAYSTTLASVASNTETITSVNSSGNRILILSTHSGSAQESAGMECQAVITNDTTVTVTRGSSTGTAICDFFVIELPPL